MNERFFSYCLKKFREKQDELGKIIGAEKEYSPMKQALKEKGLIKEDDHREDLLYEIYQVVCFAVKQLNCSFFEAWNGDYIDIYEALIFKIKNGGDD
ncbi:hypothetical protein [Acetobacterium wieringae]|uniref:Uncharacterized protein n=1 Tax=Acetobacterium wieringae TaxID=52694 RepID=A0A1F2PMQ6_9FIRM|nr:hypothetical protein [Acetobacterium wieringae]OFV72114.1 hypothetical protein ACWI_03640 [Acetobacterium wieringae]